MDFVSRLQKLKIPPIDNIDKIKTRRLHDAAFWSNKAFRLTQGKKQGGPILIINFKVKRRSIIDSEKKL